MGVIAAALIPYEVYFYSSGAVEEGWGKQDLGVNKANSLLGWALGGILSAALIGVSAKLFHPLGIEPDFIGTNALTAEVPIGQTGLLVAFLGTLFAVGGAAVESSFSGAYNLAQFLGWDWASTAARGGPGGSRPLGS